MHLVNLLPGHPDERPRINPLLAPNLVLSHEQRIDFLLRLYAKEAPPCGHQIWPRWVLRKICSNVVIKTGLEKQLYPKTLPQTEGR